MEMVITALVLSFAVNFVLLSIARRLQSDKLTDASYVLSFAAVALYGLSHARFSPYHLCLFIFIMLWALRIGSFLLYRVLKVSKDVHFSKIRESFWAFLRFWVGQSVAVWIVLVPPLFAFLRNSATLNGQIMGKK